MCPDPVDLAAAPRVLIAEAIEAYGRHATIDTCLATLEGMLDFDRLPVPLTFLAGDSAIYQMERGHLEERVQTHWPRTWGARGLLYVWEDYAEPVVVAALHDDHWRVREMAAKVVLHHEVGSAAEALLDLIADEEPRVQVAAIRASGSVGESEHVAALDSLVTRDTKVRVAASTAVRTLRRRLDLVSS
ncbi:HEAT repeat domain-containing protein [Solicola sp. PLA-1-18]|uniref:HEAT repeat domain-containing protein n=1 Tax=Solicola sp. PLA-1-18 TaxID=3380532 RepID=UPI003B7CFE65